MVCGNWFFGALLHFTVFLRRILLLFLPLNEFAFTLDCGDNENNEMHSRHTRSHCEIAITRIEHKACESAAKAQLNCLPMDDNCSFYHFENRIQMESKGAAYRRERECVSLERLQKKKVDLLA